MLHRLMDLLFPPKCILCGKLLTRQETDLCHDCRTDGPEFIKAKRKIPFVAQWTGIWYYKGAVSESIQRYKFGNARRYADAYARLLALRLQQEDMDTFDILSWIPISPTRQRKRGYDQCYLLAKALGRELGCKPVRVLSKTLDNPPQSGITSSAERRANVLGVYAARNKALFRGKRVLLLDDVITTGSTASECAKTLQYSGVKDVYLATIAVADKK